MAEMKFDPDRFQGKSACVLGLGRSGLAVANLLARRGFPVLVSESRPRARIQQAVRRLHYHVQLEAGGHGARAFKAGFLVKSPGIPSHAPVLAEARRRGLPVFSELEVALAFAPAPRLYAVTGTNGKTTTTRLLGAVLRAAGVRAHVAGNVGTPLSAVLDEVCVGDALVLEVSSYQLEDSRWLRPRAACILNLTPDHLDHHGSREAYAAAKARVFARQLPEDLCVFNAGDPAVRALAAGCRARRLFFALRRAPGAQAWRERGRIVAVTGGRAHRLQPPALPGDHNVENAMAAALMALGTGVAPEAVQRGFAGFKGVEHRIEPVATVDGIRCVNDSKATNVDSTLVALRSFPARRRLLLILGGLDKGAPYAPLRPEIARKVRALFTIGSAADKIAGELGGAAPIVACATLERAVAAALGRGRDGDTLLLSPACASFDQFEDFEDRGRRFKELVAQHGRSELRG